MGIQYLLSDLEYYKIFRVCKINSQVHIELFESLKVNRSKSQLRRTMGYGIWSNCFNDIHLKHMNYTTKYLMSVVSTTGKNFQGW